MKLISTISLVLAALGMVAAIPQSSTAVSHILEILSERYSVKCGLFLLIYLLFSQVACSNKCASDETCYSECCAAANLASRTIVC